jgi:hypothetical protein
VKKICTILISLVAILPVALSSSCARFSKEKKSQDIVIQSIGVLPVKPASIGINPSDTKTKEQLEAGSQIIDTLLTDYFRDHKNVHFISQTELESLQAVQTGNSLYVAREAGRQLGYDAILLTEVSRYQARTGNAYAVETPASVAFSFKLLAVANSQVIWGADFDQTQQPLFENILQSRTTGSGFRWLTAAELTQAGLTKKLNSCSYLH